MTEKAKIKLKDKIIAASVVANIALGVVSYPVIMSKVRMRAIKNMNEWSDYLAEQEMAALRADMPDIGKVSIAELEQKQPKGDTDVIAKLLTRY